MNMMKYVVYILLTLALTAGLPTVSRLHASEAESTNQSAIPPARPGELYLASSDSMADVAAVLEAARKSNKLALVIMGANWCHDSRALASRLQQEPLSSLVNEFYETIFVDVGYLEKGKDVINSLGSPVYYATPTVLIVDPVSGQLLNANNRHQWADANNISMEESIKYFQLMADTDLTTLQGESTIGGTLQELLAEIDAFEQLQANRLYKAYSVLGPMLKAYKNGEKDQFSEDQWNEVRDFRYKVPSDLATLRAEAHQRVTAGDTSIELDYPDYPAFSWENKGP